MEAALVHVRSDGKQQPVPLRAGKVVIGRQDDCQLRIPSAQISRHHCEILTGGAGVRIRDLGSSNGTFVNGQKVDDAALSPGDVIAVGPMLFVVRINGQPAQINPEELTRRVQAASAREADTPADLATNEDSSVDFDFDFSDDEDDEQPAL